MELLKAVLFGIVEGVTEWLPISSTGHLILLNEFITLNVSDEFRSMFDVVIQLGAILEEILAPEQYDTNVATIPGSTQRVEYAIRMPGVDGNSVWLPIDSKFPGDTYAHLQDAQASGDAQAVENARHALELVLRSEAKDIREKYVEPPYTTAFGILFLPFEGLYAEAQQPANGLQDPCHPEALRRGVAAAGGGQDRVR